MRLASVGKDNGKSGSGARNRTALMRNTMGIALAGGELFPRTCRVRIGKSGKNFEPGPDGSFFLSPESHKKRRLKDN